jgi:hypothetical protein
MAGTLRPVRFKLAWQTYSVGDEITPNGTLRDWLFANGYIEEVLPDKVPPIRDKNKVLKQARGGVFRR